LRVSRSSTDLIETGERERERERALPHTLKTERLGEKREKRERKEFLLFRFFFSSFFFRCVFRFFCSFLFSSSSEFPTCHPFVFFLSNRKERERREREKKKKREGRSPLPAPLLFLSFFFEVLREKQEMLLAGLALTRFLFFSFLASSV